MTNKHFKKIGVFLSFFSLLFPSALRATSLGIVSDIHAGNIEMRELSDVNTFYPIRYCQNMENVKKSEVDYILTLGDNTLNGRSSEAEKILGCMQGYDNVLWTKGNHDKEEAWQYFNTPNYYSKDLGKWKIIVLDSSKLFPAGTGGFLPEQLLWLEQELLSGNECVLIAMHHPIFHFERIFSKIPASNIYTRFRTDLEIATVYPAYGVFEHMLEASGKVKYVFSGHVHTRQGCKNIDGINYCAIPALSLNGKEGYYFKLTLQ